MKMKSACLSAVFLAAVTGLSACTAVPYSLRPPAPVGVEPAPAPDGSWTPYGRGNVPSSMPERRVDQAPGWEPPVNDRPVSVSELPPVERVEPVDPIFDRDQPADGHPVQSGSDGWGSYRSAPVNGADSARPYSSRPITKKTPARQVRPSPAPADAASAASTSSTPSFTAGSSRVEVDPTWSARNVPADMRVEVNTMVLQAARAGSSKWVGLDGRNYSATAVKGMPNERCVEVVLGIGTDDREDVGPQGNATVCPR